MTESVLIKPKELMYFIQLSSKTSFWKLDDIFPECTICREPSPLVEPLVCIREDACHVGHNCMDTLARRLHALFEEVVPQYVNLILLYFKKRNVKGIGAGVFWRDFRTPRVITMNPGGWARVKIRGEIFKFTPGESFFLSGRAAPPEPTTPENKAILP